MCKNLLILLGILVGFSVIIACGEDVVSTVGDDDDAGGNGGGTDFAGGEIGETCFADDECKTGLICVQGFCAEKQCSSDGDCASGMVCEASQCIAPAGDDDDGEPPVDDDDDNDDNNDEPPVDDDDDVSGGCGSDADCSITPNTPKCDIGSGQCVQCLVDADCGAGLTCANYVCKSSGGGGDDDDDDNGGGGTSGCAADEECCDVQGTGLCLAAGSNCQGITQSTPQCGAGNQCSGGRVPVQAQDQQGNQLCLCLSTCTLGGGGGGGGGKPCSTSSECTDPNYPVCDAFGSGVCVECMGDFDCAAGERCDANSKTCVTGGGGGGGGGGGTTCPSGTTCQEVQGYGFCLDSNGQPPASTPMCDLNNPSCPDAGQVPVQAQDQNGNPVCICLYECTPPGGGGGGGGGGGSVPMCGPCTSDADCQSGLLCTSGLTGNICGTGDMFTDLLMCMMGGGGGFP